MSDLEAAYNSDQEVSENHSKLIQAVSQLDKKQRVSKAERSEPTLEVSEFHLVKSGITNKDAVQVRDLVKSLGQKGYQSQVAKKLHSVQRKSKRISKPLEKPIAEKVKMKLGFEHTLKDLSKYNAIVARNRTATQLSFPLRNPKQNLKTNSPADFINRLRFKSDLQQKLEALDPPKEPLPEEKNDKEAKSNATLIDVKRKRSETASRRARQSYQEAKAHRQRKIKSKQFHRIERKKRDKKQLKEFEDMQKNNPEEALMTLEQLDKSRAEERMSLRHKNTGRWAKNKQIKAKYNKEIRQELAQQLSISKKLTEKAMSAADSEDEVPLVFPNNDEEKSYNDREIQPEICLEFVQSYQEKPEEEKDDETVEFMKFQGFIHKLAEAKKKEKTAVKVDNESKISANTHKWYDILLKTPFSDEPNKTGNTVVIPASSKTEESIKDKKASKEANTNCTVTSDEIVSKRKKIKLSEKKDEAKVKDKRNAKATSAWQIEELQYNEKMDFKTRKAVDLDDMFDSVEENIKRKVNLKVQKIKKKLEAGNKVNKHKEKHNKENKDYMPNLEFKVSKQKPILDLSLEETTSREDSQQDTDLTRLKTVMNTEQKSMNKPNSAEKTDMQKLLINTKLTYLETEMPDLDVDEEDMLVENDYDGKDGISTLMREAEKIYKDENVEEEFRKEKEEEIKNSQPQDINMKLPGWGTWAGTNIKEKKTRRRNRRFILKFPKDAPRKDENKGDVIIFEGANPKLKEHLVSELPYPFTTVKDFEASMRAPLGRTFVPENAHRRLIQPSIITKSGQVIEPMTEDVLLKKQPIVKRRIDKYKKNNMKNIKKTQITHNDVK